MKYESCSSRRKGIFHGGLWRKSHSVSVSLFDYKNLSLSLVQIHSQIIPGDGSPIHDCRWSRRQDEITRCFGFLIKETLHTAAFSILQNLKFPNRTSLIKILFSSDSKPPVLRPKHSPIHRVTGDISPGVERPGSDADHSLPSSA
jgi:hypothetical protein